MKRIILILMAVAVAVAAGFLVLSVARHRSSISSGGGAVAASASGVLAEAKEKEASNKLVEAKALYQQLVNEFPSSSEIMNWQKKIEELNMKLVFSPALVPGKSAMYEIKPGDSLSKISKEFKTTIELIMRCNGLVDDKIIPGKKIKVWTSPFSIFVDKSQNILLLKVGDEIFKTYVVSTGANNSTPVGTLKIINKLSNPTWFKSGAVVPAGSPENVLGTRWLGFNIPGYGIHGTIEPQTLGQQVTQGCVRMANPDVEELYSLIPVDTEVIITD